MTKVLINVKMSIQDITSVLKLHFQYMVEPENGLANDGPFWPMKSQFEQFAKEVKVYTFPVTKRFGININSYAITDYEQQRLWWSRETGRLVSLGGRMEAKNWWKDG